MNRKIIMDCDPGQDDAMALMLAASKISGLQIEAITTVAGNVNVEKNTRNALRLCDLLGLQDVPVAQGASRPLFREMLIAEHIHGESGLDGTTLPEQPVKQPVDQHGVDLMIDKLIEADEPITLVPTGPLTNVAMAFRKEPAILPKVKEIVLMGGGTYGNRTPAAEFNIYADAEAAKVVFDSGVPVAMFGLDVTHQALATAETIEEIKTIDNPVATAVSEMLTFYMNAYQGLPGFTGAAIHDPCPVAYLIDPFIFEMEKVHVDVETKGEFTYGMTCITKGVSDTNTNFACKLHQKKFWDLFYRALQSYSN
ncbi:nucleoside hydrolase [Virgibacillus siamensis]|uniref:nucleoside hydrolase n=1 Tax=Virgibacillus siamensis TaxID=480071 RepID=UPI000985E509|nr:nucleoside hydrolase [Virgibacillus siamensis]